MNNRQLSSFEDYKGLVVDTKLELESVYRLKNKRQVFWENKEARIFYEIEMNTYDQKVEKIIIRPLLHQEIIPGFGFFETCFQATLEILLFTGTVINMKLGDKNYNLPDIQKLYPDTSQIMEIYDLVSDEADWYLQK
jgi:hypothetical protein